MRKKYGNSIRDILHLTDFSRDSTVAWAHALRMAVGVKGKLEVLHVEREKSRPDWSRYPGVRETLTQWNLLPEGASRHDVARLGVGISKSAAQDSDPVAGVLDHLERRDADLVVMATHRREGLDRWLHAGIAQSISSQIEAAALLIPYGIDGFVNTETGAVTLERVLIPIDHVPDPRPVIHAVAEIVEAIAPGEVEVRLLHVGDRSGMPSPRLPDGERCIWRWETVGGNVVDAICSDASEHKVNLIAMMTNGHDGFLDVLRGSTTERVLHRAECAVLSMHAAEN